MILPESRSPFLCGKNRYLGGMKIRNLFYIEKMDKWDFYSILIYLIITLIIYFDSYGLITRNIVLFYSYLTPLCLYLFNYKSLRKFNVWVIWFFISLFHIILYHEISGIPKYMFYRGPASNSLKFTWLFLLLFQLLRIVSIKFQRLELVAPNKGSLDIWDNRKLTFIDNICFVIFGAVFIFMGIVDYLFN
ncbi:hypothetical protein SAMN04487891_10119 [Flagellimonas taeanensis]|uniref:Uncharacterized protein n=1 Tax=Flagellimonas taeanensis TaxID=1005926 RepID=A0A1M6P3J3_9FLAO|nr:hypothetical protein SAMN04487891_10119 [Allomuricauda taeanensis]SHK02476.1 hypothetical protein SAMN05216293_0019 [Allomuricauda taeanensis]